MDVAIDFTYPEIVQYSKNFHREIGEGGFSRVYKGRIPTDNRHGLMKQKIAIRVNKRSDPGTIEQFENEIRVMTRHFLPNIVHLIGYCRTNESRYLVLPLVEGGSLCNKIQELTWEETLIVLEGIARATSVFNNSRQMVLTDLKTSNIMLEKDFSPRLCDFGAVGEVGTDNELAGTPGFRNPFAVARMAREFDDDVYSLGIIILQLIMKEDKVFDNSIPQARMRHISSWASQQYAERGDIVHPRLKATGCSANDAISITHLALTMTLRAQDLAALHIPAYAPNDPELRPPINFVTNSLRALTVDLSYGSIKRLVHRLGRMVT